MFFILFLNFFFFGILSTTYANPLACPVCAVAIASGLGISRALGVDDSVVGVWLGAILLALSQWTAYFFEKKNIKNIFVKILCYACWYATIIPLYLGSTPKIIFNTNKKKKKKKILVKRLVGKKRLFTCVKVY